MRDEVPRLPALSLLCEPPRRKRARAARAKNRAKLTKRGLVRRGDGLQIHHRNHDNRDNRSCNLQVIRASAHRRLHARKPAAKKKAKKPSKQ